MPKAKKRLDLPCRNCGARPTVRSHLMPLAFSHMVLDGDKNMLLFQAKDAKRRAAQSAHIDHDILCSTCEQILGKLDQYAAEFCRRCKTLPQLVPMYFLAKNVDTDKLVRFAASIVYRYAISTRTEAVDVRLSPEQETLFRAASFGASAPVLHPQLALMRCTSAKIRKVEHYMMLPTLHEWGGATQYCFSAGGFRWAVQVEASQWPPNLKPGPINGSAHVTGRQIVLEDSTEFRHLARVYSLSQRAARARRSK